MVEPMQTRLAIAYESAPVRDLFGRPSGADWYASARAHVKRLARKHDVSEARAAGVIAAMSPRTQWRENLRRADDALAGIIRGLPASRKASAAIVAGARPLDALGGPKVRAFYRNLSGDLSAVTVDVWAARAAGENPERFDYDLVADAYRRAAELCGAAPAELQSVVWVGLRGSAD